MKLGVNIDHIATLRQARVTGDWRWPLPDVYPDPLRAALVSQRAGAHSIVMHLREDRRHIQDGDVFRVRDAISIRLNLEMSIAPSVMKVAKKLRPEQATLVPERRLERTTEGGLNVFSKRSTLQKAISELQQRRIEVSLFIDPDLKTLEESVRLGADAVEFHTGDYANAKTPVAAKKELERLRRAVVEAGRLGILAHAGHGLDYQNVKAVTKLRGLTELNIGYSIVSRALSVGLEKAVRDMKRLIA